MAGCGASICSLFHPFCEEYINQMTQMTNLHRQQILGMLALLVQRILNLDEANRCAIYHWPVYSCLPSGLVLPTKSLDEIC